MEQNARYHVVFYGDIAEGQALEDVKGTLTTMFRLSPERVDAVLAGKPLIIKENVGRNEALKYKTAFEKSGARCRIVPVKRKTAQKTPASSSSQSTSKAKTPPKKPRSRQFFFTSGIPQDLLEKAIQSYARAFRQEEEQALLLLELGSSGPALLLSDRRLYVRRLNAPPRTLKLIGIRAVDVKDRRILINKQPVLVLPESFQENVPALIDAIHSAVKKASLLPAEEEAVRSQDEDVPASSRGNLVKIIAMAAIALVVLGVGFRIIWPSKQKEELPPTQVATVANEEETSPEKLQATPEPAGSEPTPAQSASCRRTNHYKLPGGSIATLRFSRKYPPWKGAELRIKKGEQPTSFTLRQDPLGQYGFLLGFSMVTYESHTLSHQVWALDGRKMFAEIRKDPSYNAEMEVVKGGVPTNVPIVHHAAGMEIHWRDTGYAVIEALDRLKDKRDIGKLSWAELKEKISPQASQAQVIYIHNGKRFELLATQIQDEEVITIQSYDIDITVPETLHEPPHGSEYIYFVPFGSQEASGKENIKLNLSWYNSNKDNKFYVNLEGPGVTIECFP